MGEAEEVAAQDPNIIYLEVSGGEGTRVSESEIGADVYKECRGHPAGTARRDGSYP